MISVRLATGAAALAAGVVVTGAAGAVQPSETTITCANITSGASWQIRIDYEDGLVDSNPAHITNAEISWQDARDGGHYTLDRKSGDLLVIVASSTGGWLLHHRCALEKPS